MSELQFHFRIYSLTLEIVRSSIREGVQSWTASKTKPLRIASVQAQNFKLLGLDMVNGCAAADYGYSKRFHKIK